MLKPTLLLFLILTLLLSACAPGLPAVEDALEKSELEMPQETAAPLDEMPAEAATAAHSETMQSPAETLPAVTPVEMAESPAWFSAVLTDVQSGQTFSINDYHGKVVLLETLAIWCSNCKKQQIQVKALHEALGTHADLISIGLDIDPNENAGDLKSYTASNGFDWTYAVAPVEVVREISSLYGDQFLNPPSTPMLVVDRNGQVHTLPFGIKSAAQLQEFLEPFLNEGV